MRLAYSALLYLATPFLLIRLLMRARKAPDYLNRWGQRFGFYGKNQPQDVIWFHTVSVGEAEAAFPLINKVLEQNPDTPFLVTTTTPTGAARVKAFLGHRVHHVYLPYDLPGAMRRFFRRFKPRIAIILETEIWPNMLFQAKRHSVPSLIVNARLSEKSFKGYARLGGFIEQTLANVTHVCAQTDTAAERFVQLGLPNSNVSVLGNIKFDIAMPSSLKEQAEAIKRDWFQQRPSWIAASTHEGEDEQVLAAFADIKKNIPDALLVLVPRHPERFDTVAKLSRLKGFSVTRRSEQSGEAVSSDVFLLDTMGELKLYYATVDVAFVGGSLVPTGGHNMLEPAAVALPIVFGPHVFNFVEISNHLLTRKAAITVQEADQLAAEVTRLLQHAEQRSEMGAIGQQFVEQNRGAVEAVSQKINRLLTAN